MSAKVVEIIISGEQGTGKTLMAKAIMAALKRAGFPVRVEVYTTHRYLAPSTFCECEGSVPGKKVKK